MKRRKYLYLLLLGVLLITIGGVFATWTYGVKQSEDKIIQNNTIGVEKAETTVRGEISTRGGGFNIKFNDTDYDHEVSLNKEEVIVTGNSLFVKFIPTRGTSIDLLAPNYYLNFKLSSSLSYKDDLVLVSTEHTLALPNKGTFYELELTSDLVYSLIDSVNLSLPTNEDYETFSKALKEASFSIVISDDADQM